jgi:hypothetical protein
VNDQQVGVERRKDALRRLVIFATPVESARAELAGFGWDSDDELVSLTRADALRVLRRYADGTLSADTVAEWAETIEGRDDVGREPGFEQQLNDFLFEFANPDLAGPLTPERWIQAFS